MTTHRDEVLIKESMMLIGLLQAPEEPSANDLATAVVVLREMRAETEAARLARRLTKIWVKR